MTATNIADALSNSALSGAQLVAELALLNGQLVSIRLDNWKLHDWQPRDDWFQVEGQIAGSFGSLRIFLNKGAISVDGESLIYESAKRSPPSRLVFTGLVGENWGTLGTGLFLELISVKAFDDENAEVDDGL